VGEKDVRQLQVFFFPLDVGRYLSDGLKQKK